MSFANATSAKRTQSNPFESRFSERQRESGAKTHARRRETNPLRMGAIFDFPSVGVGAGQRGSAPSRWVGGIDRWFFDRVLRIHPDPSDARSDPTEDLVRDRLRVPGQFVGG